MRIGVVNWTAREVGGAERYLSNVLPLLAERGHELALVVEMDRPEDRDRIAMPIDSPVWCIEEKGQWGAIEALQRWSPDVIFSHVILDPAVEKAVQSVGSSVLFAHAYYGTCISGTKTRSFPTPTPCKRVFGPGCLLNFYPRRCGGLNPITMIANYRTQMSRRELLAGYVSILTNSTHMVEEYLRNGVPADRIAALPMPVYPDNAEASAHLQDERRDQAEIALIMAGRMDRLKGGILAMNALPEISSVCERPVRLVMVGDGPERQSWERHARKVEDRFASVSVEFTGWISGAALSDHFARADLLLVPSQWPEPYGMVGPEAGLNGLPAVAFRIGGIPDWLEDGVNGYFATGIGNTPHGLATAASRALRDPDHLLVLREGAREVARKFTRENHVSQLVEVLDAATGETRITEEK